ncbi:MAG: tetratricopeptide repeat protein [Gammaproteobacteria bacterium]
MRNGLLIALVAITLTACAGTFKQQEAPTSPTTGSGQSGRVPDVGRAMSPAGAALIEESQRQRRAGQTAQASATLERALRVEPEHPAVWQELGQLRFEQGDFAQAEQMGRKALSLSPTGSLAQSYAQQLIADAQRAQKR